MMETGSRLAHFFGKRIAKVYRCHTLIIRAVAICTPSRINKPKAISTAVF